MNTQVQERTASPAAAAPQIAEKMPSAAQTWQFYMGSLFKREINGEADVLDLIQKGVTGAVYSKLLSRLELPKDAIGAETTIRNRLKSAARLNADESERLVMIVRVYASALSLFGTEEKALAWLHKPARYLREGPPVAPITLAKFEPGVRLLEERLLRTAHGVF